MSSSRRNRSGPPISMMPFNGAPTETLAIALATSSAAIGWMSTGGRRTVSPAVAASAIGRMNSKNWVAWTIENGIEELVISFSWASLAR